MNDLRNSPGFWYLASPYSKYRFGHDAAFRAAASNAGILTRAGIVVFSPITHSHPLIQWGNVSGTDFAAWERFDRAMIDAAIGCILCRMPGWNESEGIKRELEIFRLQSKPIIEMEPGYVPAEFLGTTTCTMTGMPHNPDATTEAARDARS